MAKDTRLQKMMADCGVASRRKAEEMIAQGRVKVNGRPAKASYDVKQGDIIEVTFGQRTLKVRVLDVKDFTAKSDASSLYEVIE